MKRIKNTLPIVLTFVGLANMGAHCPRTTTLSRNDIMQRVIEIAQEDVLRGGLPFATIIVDKEGRIIAEAVNTVAKSHDPTDHAEIRALRMATKKLGRSDLSDCEVHVMGYPCPMCLTALMYAKPKKVYFAVSIDEKNRALKVLHGGINYYEELRKPVGARAILTEQVINFREKALSVLKLWQAQIVPSLD